MRSIERPPVQTLKLLSARAPRPVQNVVAKRNGHAIRCQVNENGAGEDYNSLAAFVRSACRVTAACICSAAIVLAPGLGPGLGSGWPAGPASAQETYNIAAYESAVAGRRGDADGLNLSLFTDDARQAMDRLRQYAHYMRSDEVAAAEEACGQECCDNREVVASEHYSANGTFTQAGWADALLNEMKSRGGLIPNKRELHAAVASLMASLADPYTEFLPPSAFRRALRRPLPAEQSYLRAQYVGLGLELGPVAPEGGRLVLAPLAGSPAEAAGIARGDRLISIDGTPVDSLGPEQLRGLMRGPAGSTATLEWVPAPTASAGAAAAAAATAAAAAARAGPTGGADVTPAAAAAMSTAAAADAGGAVERVVMDVERRDLPQPAIKVSQLPIGPPGFYVTYVRLLYWGSETTEGLQAALRLHERAPGNVGWILDLRNNPGGVFEEAVAAASLFLSPGDVVAKTIRGPEEVVDTVWQVGSLPEDVFPSLPGRLAVKPVVLLGNRSTASASEVFAGALRDNGRATLLGERTFGKGLVQYYFPLREGKDGGVRVTVAKYLTPSGYDISSRGAGLIPDRVCTDFPRGGPPTSLQQADKCIQQAAGLLGVRT
ncbi:hypothetical protein GPECTOR_15g362 [Gonium pectorale]|uniref:PDZ domain-containing protein n=1 Tax=Gonium pectorale TaxID=33097 RepID=A0A150GLM2_GONPE|nr:hypothetical protein GPECTOR_15g362 [Gonium pectorale]|eukprot:KXZ50678.1 hypothetical protein GPECTOR_15g362 [Gonium pectorale]